MHKSITHDIHANKTFEEICLHHFGQSIINNNDTDKGKQSVRENMEKYIKYGVMTLSGKLLSGYTTMADVHYIVKLVASTIGARLWLNKKLLTHEDTFSEYLYNNMSGSMTNEDFLSIFNEYTDTGKRIFIKWLFSGIFIIDASLFNNRYENIIDPDFILANHEHAFDSVDFIMNHVNIASLMRAKAKSSLAEKIDNEKRDLIFDNMRTSYLKNSIFTALMFHGENKKDVFSIYSDTDAYVSYLLDIVAFRFSALPAGSVSSEETKGIKNVKEAKKIKCMSPIYAYKKTIKAFPCHYGEAVDTFNRSTFRLQFPEFKSFMYEDVFRDLKTISSGDYRKKDGASSDPEGYGWIFAGTPEIDAKVLFSYEASLRSLRSSVKNIFDCDTYADCNAINFDTVLWRKTIYDNYFISAIENKHLKTYVLRIVCDDDLQGLFNDLYHETIPDKILKKVILKIDVAKWNRHVELFCDMIDHVYGLTEKEKSMMEKWGRRTIISTLNKICFCSGTAAEKRTTAIEQWLLTPEPR